MDDSSIAAGAAFDIGSDQDDDDVFDEDLEALRRACMITGRIPEGVEDSDYGDGGSDSDDIDLLSKIRKRFALTATPVGGDDEPLVVKPLNTNLVSDEDEDDFETLRAIQRRFEQYQNDSLQKNHEADSVTSGKDAGEELFDTSLEKRNGQPSDQESQPSVDYELPLVNHWNHGDDGASKFTAVSCHFSKYCQLFVDALKKNRTYQKFIRNKMIQIEAKIEQNKNLKERIRCLMDFRRRRAGRFLSQKNDPRVRLISLQRSRKPSKVKSVAEYGPDENSDVSNYKMVLTRYPILTKKQRWTKPEDEKLAKGIKQQYQEMLMLSSIEAENPGGSFGDSNMLSFPSFGDFDIASENVRTFLPLVNWDRLASMYFTGRTGAECEARWLNSADPLINRSPWTIIEDKNILHIAQNRGVFNWVDIAVRLGTYRTPFQCLLRYQRSLNAYILKREWTEEEDVQLCAAVESYGEDWQLVASCLEGRTGPQCSNRWRKTLHPDRKRVGRWSIEEDKRLKVAVLLFGAKNWNKIAQFAPGRTQSQCRERWVNCLDPSLNLEPWTEEEDSKLKAAIAEFGHCWSKVATFVPPRTDNQCLRRWKVLFPHEVPLLQAAQKMKKAVLISNFVDREKERPLLGPEDFYFTGERVNTDMENEKGNRKRKKTQREECLKQKKQKGAHFSSQSAISKYQSKRMRSKEGSDLSSQGPLSKRNKKAQTIENSDLVLDLEHSGSKFIGTETAAAPDGAPLFDIVTHSAANVNCSEGTPTFMYNHLLPDSTVMIELSEITSNTNQSVKCVAIGGINQETGISPANFLNQENAEKGCDSSRTTPYSPVNGLQSASDPICSKEVVRIAGDDCLLLDLIFSNAATNKEKACECGQRTIPCLVNGTQSAFDTNCSKEIAGVEDDDCLLLDWISHNVATDKLPEITDQTSQTDRLVYLKRAIENNIKKRTSKNMQKNGDCAKQASTIPSANGTV